MGRRRSRPSLVILAIALFGCSPQEVGVAPTSPSRRSLAPLYRQRPRTLESSETAPTQLEWPLRGVLSSRFGPREGHPHDGIDLSVSDGTEVHAAATGEVVYSGSGLRGYGNLIILRHGGGLVTIYAHNSELRVAVGARIERGQVIALSGHSGRATAPHLHFEVRLDDQPRDPELYLPPSPH